MRRSVAIGLFALLIALSRAGGGAALERARPREHKWGPRWYDQLTFHEIRVQRDRAEQQYKVEQQQAARLATQLATVRAKVQRYNTLNMTLGHQHARVSDSYSCTTCQANRTTVREAGEARTDMDRAEAQFKEQQLKLEQARKDLPQPDWSADPRPIDPSVAMAQAQPQANFPVNRLAPAATPATPSTPTAPFGPVTYSDPTLEPMPAEASESDTTESTIVPTSPLPPALTSPASMPPITVEEGAATRPSIFEP